MWHQGVDQASILLRSQQSLWLKGSVTNTLVLDATATPPRGLDRQEGAPWEVIFQAHTTDSQSHLNLLIKNLFITFLWQLVSWWVCLVCNDSWKYGLCRVAAIWMPGSRASQQNIGVCLSVRDRLSQISVNISARQIHLSAVFLDLNKAVIVTKRVDSKNYTVRKSNLK